MCVFQQAFWLLALWKFCKDFSTLPLRTEVNIQELCNRADMKNACGFGGCDEKL